MYDAVVTIFNYYESPITGIGLWYPHVLSGVDLNTDKGAILKKYGSDSTDNAELHIAYELLGGKQIIHDTDGKVLPWLPPKEWRRQVNDLLDDTITFDFSDDCFFWEGVWDSGIVDDGEYRNGFYSYMNEKYDFVYLVSSVGGPYSVIPHFEILGK